MMFLLQPANPPVICNGQSANIGGASSNGSTTFNWYDAQVGGNLLNSGSIFNPTPSTTTTYYLSTDNSAGCESSRTPVEITVSTDPNMNLITPDTTICEGGIVPLLVSSDTANVDFDWYDQLAGGVVLYTGSSTSTGVLNSDLQLFVQGTDGHGCKSDRVALTITVQPIAIIEAATIDCSNPKENEGSFHMVSFNTCR